MKSNYLHTLLLAACFNFLVGISLFSQFKEINNPAYGPDSLSRIECANELSNLAEYMKINQPDYALISWRKVYKDCPASSKNIYILGARIFTQKLDATQDLSLQQAYFDTLMMIYDDRIKYFGEEGYVLGRKGKEMLKYHGDEYQKAYKLFKKSVELEKTEADVNVLIALMEISLAMYNDDSISGDEFLNNYLLCFESLNNITATGSKKTMVESCNAKISSIINRAKFKDCSVIETAFTEKIKNSPQNLTLLNAAISLMVGSGCDDSEFYGKLFERAVQLNNTAENSYNLAKFHIKKERFKNAMTHLQNAVNIETDPENKAQYYYQMAVISHTKFNEPKEAVEYSDKAIELKPNWGDPYLIKAAAYVEGIKSCSDDPFIKSTVFWVAADICIKARLVDPSIRDKANDLITEYSRFFPNKEELFFRSLTEGSPYTVGYWINQSTTIRSKN